MTPTQKNHLMFEKVAAASQLHSKAVQLQPLCGALSSHLSFSIIAIWFAFMRLPIVLALKIIAFVASGEFIQGGNQCRKVTAGRVTAGS